MNIDKVTNKDIAEFTGKSIDTVNGWKQKQPNIDKAVRIGVFCIKNNLDTDTIKKLIEIQEAVKGVNK